MVNEQKYTEKIHGEYWLLFVPLREIKKKPNKLLLPIFNIVVRRSNIPFKLTNPSQNEKKTEFDGSSGFLRVTSHQV